MTHVRGMRSRRYQQLVDAADAAGWTQRIDGKGHLQLVPPGGGKPVWISMTLSDTNPRDWLNARAELRRGGVKI